MIKLYDAPITSAMPYHMANKPEIKALSAMFLKQVRRIIDYSDCCDFFFNLDLVDEEKLDYFAADFNVLEYRQSLDITSKTEVIKQSFENWTKAGTKWAISSIIKTIGLDFNVLEWPEFGGEPGTFKIEAENTAFSEDIYQTLSKYIEAKKRASAHLTSIVFSITTQSMQQRHAMMVNSIDFDSLKNKWLTVPYYNNHYPFLAIISPTQDITIAYDLGVSVWVDDENKLNVSVPEGVKIRTDHGTIYCETKN